jgi:hypothetical protein
MSATERRIAEGAFAGHATGLAWRLEKAVEAVRSLRGERATGASHMVELKSEMLAELRREPGGAFGLPRLKCCDAHAERADRLEALLRRVVEALDVDFVTHVREHGAEAAACTYIAEINDACGIADAIRAELKL